MPADALIAAYNEKSNVVIDYISRNPNLPDGFIQEKIQDAVGPSKPSQTKSQIFIANIARGRPEYARPIWDVVKNSRVAAVGAVQLRHNVAKAIASSSEDPQLLKVIAQAAISGFSSTGYREAIKEILTSIITNGATPDDVIQERAKNSSDTFIKMLAQARLDDPDFNEEDVADRHKEEYPDEYDDDSERREDYNDYY
jgi:hypothetical protein